MTEPDVASSDATNIATAITPDGDSYMIKGRKWWSSGAMSPDCKILIVMGVTGEPGAGGDRSHSRHSMILVPRDTPGVRVKRGMMVFGYDDGTHGGHAEVLFDNVRVPRVIDRAIQAHSGGGVSQDFPLAHLWASARTLRFADGPDEVHKRSLARREIRNATS
jgi:alkylation response protein AidB-like acyl-CoA dehydrogenase